MDRLTYIDAPESAWSSQISLAWPYSEVLCAVSACKINRSCVFWRDLKLLADCGQISRFQSVQVLFMGDAARCWVHVNSSYSLQELGDNNWREVVNISRRKLCHLLGNIRGRYKRCLEIGSWHFEAFIQSKASWTEGAIWTLMFPADAEFVCGKAPMTASMPRGMTEVHHVVSICENLCTLPNGDKTSVKHEVKKVGHTGCNLNNS